MSDHPAIKLILSDIDGTLLPFGKKVVSPRVRAAFHAAMDAGIHVGPASGRGISHVTPTFDGDDACVATALGTNGMQVYLDGKLIHEEHVDRDALVHVCQVIHGMPGVGAIVFDGGTPLLVEGRREDLAYSFPVYAKQAIDASEMPHFPIVKMNVFISGDIEATRRLYDIVSAEVPELGFNVPLAGFLNLAPVGYSKATGIRILCDALGIGIDQVVTFGDGGNDIEMIAEIPNGVAVAGAAPEVTAAARWHVGRCEDDAVPAAIEALAAGEWPFTE
ncbi:MAG: HAD family phosphatase [Atopobiaceae bacterium]|nr:HAD family phosphatase [Atopobiaceae bacterium]